MAARIPGQRLRQRRKPLHLGQGRKDDVTRPRPARVSPRRSRRACARVPSDTSFVMSFTPTTTTSTFAGCSRRRSTIRRTSSERAPVAATICQRTRPCSRRASSRARWPASACRCVGAPTPAALESPAMRSRRAVLPAPADPSRAPAASGNSGRERRNRVACAYSRGPSTALAATWITRASARGSSGCSGTARPSFRSPHG